MTTCSLLVLAALWGGVFAAGPSLGYGDAGRLAHLRSALWAVQSTPPQQLEQARAYMAAIERGACNSSSERLRVECLMTAARRFCRNKKSASRDTCMRVLDVAMSNALNERSIIDTSRRYELMRRERNVRAALRREAEQIHAGWVLDFHLAHGGATTCGASQEDCTAEAIDRFCLRAGDRYNQSWQGCAAALVWFIGATPQTPASVPRSKKRGEP